MKTIVRGFALGALLCATALAPAVAADQMRGNAMSGPALTCVPMATSDRASAVAKMDGHDVMLSCKPTEMMMGDKKMIGTVASKTRAYGPNVDNLLTPGEIDAAWTKWTTELLHLDRMVP
ncbi:MAG: hypothetical protein NVSMB5_08270 [Candidatus Velthaea sp.]